MTFREFLSDRIDTHLGSIRPAEYSGQTLERMVPAYLAVLVELAAPESKSQTTRLAWMATQAGERANAVLAAFAESPDAVLPTAPEIRSCWARNWPSEARETLRGCPGCGGNGWNSVEGPYGASAAYPCDHTGRQNERMGVAISPAVEEHYRQEAVAAQRRRAAWEAAGKPRFGR